MSEYVVIYEVVLGAQHRPTGATRHYQGEVPLPAPAKLQIVQFEDDGGYYLLYLDEGGMELTDTHHCSLDEAMAQAEWKFQVGRADWRRVT